MKFHYKYLKTCKIKYNNFYILKCDVSKFFASINHDILKEKLKIKYYVRYQDDWCLYHESKEYLKYCLEQIKVFLKKEKLDLNKKSRIYKNTNNFIFLGRDKRGKYAKYRTMRRRINKKNKEYKERKITLKNLVDSTVSYKYVSKRLIVNE